MEIKWVFVFFICITLLTGCEEASISKTLTDNSININEKMQNKLKSEETTLPEANPNPVTEWWKPQPNTSWHWQLEGELNLNYEVEMYDLDLFDTSKETIANLQNRGIKVICYFSAGSYEEWREDYLYFPSSVLGNTLDGWEDEKWLDISKLDLLAPIMTTRLDLAVEKGCDGVEPDNVDSYLNNPGFSLTFEDQITYNRWLAEEAHVRGLTIGLKNDLNQILSLVDYFDFALNEQCFEYEECNLLIPFIEQNKAVFGVEYNLPANDFCTSANNLNFDWLKMDLDLDGGRIACR